MNRKVRAGWFSFSCCEDSTIIFTEILNEHFWELKKKIDFISILVLKKKSEIKNLDISFVEGAITSEDQENKLKEIRNNSKYLVAIGACACVGMPSSQRNMFSPKDLKEIEPILTRFKYSAKVRKLSEVVAVDGQVPGCPMNEENFLRVLDEFIRKVENEKS